jgi:hypothetical protein
MGKLDGGSLENQIASTIGTYENLGPPDKLRINELEANEENEVRTE